RTAPGPESPPSGPRRGDARSGSQRGPPRRASPSRGVRTSARLLPGIAVAGPVLPLDVAVQPRRPRGHAGGPLADALRLDGAGAFAGDGAAGTAAAPTLAYTVFSHDRSSMNPNEWKPCSSRV